MLLTGTDVNAFFNDWYNAIQFATTNTSLSITPIVTAVNPVKSTPIAFGDLLSALVAGLAFIGAPAFTATIAASASAQAFVTGLQQAPGLVKALWPTGSAEVNKTRKAIITTTHEAPLTPSTVPNNPNRQPRLRPLKRNHPNQRPHQRRPLEPNERPKILRRIRLLRRLQRRPRPLHPARRLSN